MTTDPRWPADRERLRANLDHASIEQGRHWYRALTPDGSLWCESSDPDDVARRAEDLEDCRLEKLWTYIVRTPWEPWTPDAEGEQ